MLILFTSFWGGFAQDVEYKTYKPHQIVGIDKITDTLNMLLQDSTFRAEFGDFLNEKKYAVYSFNKAGFYEFSSLEPFDSKDYSNSQWQNLSFLNQTLDSFEIIFDPNEFLPIDKNKIIEVVAVVKFGKTNQLEIVDKVYVLDKTPLDYSPNDNHFNIEPIPTVGKFKTVKHILNYDDFENLGELIKQINSLFDSNDAVAFIKNEEIFSLIFNIKILGSDFQVIDLKSESINNGNSKIWQGRLTPSLTSKIISKLSKSTLKISKKITDINPDSYQNLTLVLKFDTLNSKFYFDNGTLINEILVNDQSNEIYEWYSVSEKAEFPGGEEQKNKFINENLIVPDSFLSQNGYDGFTVIVAFVIEKDGSITNVEISNFSKRKEIPELDNAAIEVVKKMPKWIPAKQGDVIVRSRMTTVVKFEK